MSKILVVGDIHQNTSTADKYTEKWDGNIIYLGDVFDQFYDTPKDAANAAVWLKESLNNPKHIHLMGNHDFQYMLPIGSGVFCSGYTPEKHKVISQILTKEDWSKVKYFHVEDNCWFSHAGVSYKWFSHPVHGVNVNVVNEVINKAKVDISGRIYNSFNFMALWGADYARGGRYDKGGILWNDWRNIDFFKGVTQIVGHTPRDSIKSHSRKGGTCINVDTNLNECIIINTENSSFDKVTL